MATPSRPTPLSAVPSRRFEASVCQPEWEVTTETDWARLYTEMARNDDDPDTLKRARNCLCHALHRIEPAARPILSHWVPQQECPAMRDAGLDVPKLDTRDPHWLADELVVLRRICQAGTGEHPVHALLFGAYERWRAARSRSAASARWDVSVCSSGDVSGEAAALRLALSCFPSQFFAEIVGYMFAAAKSARSITTGPLRARPAGIEQLAAEQAVVQVALRELGGGIDPQSEQWLALRQRIAVGMALQRDLLFRAAAREDGSTDPAQALIQALRCKARYAEGFHGGVSLDGRSLDAWFADDPFDAAALLNAIARSEWVDRDFPERSRILQLLEFDGPMFGVFTDEERAGLRLWLGALSAGGADATPGPIPPAQPGHGVASTPSRGSAKESRAHGQPVFRPMASATAVTDSPRSDVITMRTGHRPELSDTRALYWTLLNIEQHPDSLASVQRDVERSLARVAGLRFRSRPPFRYSDRAFEAWLNGQYRKQLKKPNKSRTKPLLSCDAYRFGIEQLAPAILVDGCWLQRAEQLRHCSPEVAQRLMTIYADELGNGVVAHNHPHVYRRLLESLRIELPEAASVEFAGYSGFLETAFDFPVFMLGIGLLPHRFLPELLGLNLAIELSGLGTSYSRLAAELDYWGISSRIVRLHQSIDNLASGHAALARDCVIIHLDQIRALGGEPSLQRHWQRIWIGYRSLAVVTRRFSRQLVMHYAARVATKWVCGLDRFMGCRRVLP